MALYTGGRTQGHVMIAQYGATTTTLAMILLRFAHALSGAPCYDAICSDDILDRFLGIGNR